MGRKTKDSGVDGLLVVDKPADWTSHDVVAKCRGAFQQRRAGHSGTLDPDATGVLLVGFGQATKILSFLTVLPKTYVGEVVMGRTTSTLDASGETTGTYEMSGVTIEQVRDASLQFVGAIEQIPPMVSAVQVDGVRLHELARQGIEIERKPRPVTVYRFEVGAEVEPGVFSIEVECSSGTYIRTLAADLGTALGGGAHLRNLRRTAIGSFVAEAGCVVDGALGTQPLLSIVEAMRDYPQVNVDEETAAGVRNGKVLPYEHFASFETTADDKPGMSKDRPWCVLSPEGQLLAVYARHHTKMAKPEVVLNR